MIQCRHEFCNLPSNESMNGRYTLGDARQTNPQIFERSISNIDSQHLPIYFFCPPTNGKY